MHLIIKLSHCLPRVSQAFLHSKQVLIILSQSISFVLAHAKMSLEQDSANYCNYKGAYSAYLLCNQYSLIVNHSQYSATCSFIVLDLTVASCTSFGTLSIAQHIITIFQDTLKLYDSEYLQNKDINTYIGYVHQEYAEKKHKSTICIWAPSC